METPLEVILMNTRKEGMMKFVEDNPDSFSELIQLSLANKQPYSWRAAWLLDSCMEDNDIRVAKYCNAILDTIPDKKDGYQRDLLRILSRMDLDDEQEGRYFDTCISLWEHISKIPSVRYLAFQGIVKLAKKYPELLDEVKLLTQDHYLDELSPGVKHSIKRLLKTLIDLK